MDTAARWLSGVGEYYTADKKGAAATGTPQPAKEESKSESQETSERGCYPGRLSGLKTKPAVQKQKETTSMGFGVPAWDSGCHLHARSEGVFKRTWLSSGTMLARGLIAASRMRRPQPHHG